MNILERAKPILNALADMAEAYERDRRYFKTREGAISHAINITKWPEYQKNYELANSIAHDLIEITTDAWEEGEKK